MDFFKFLKIFFLNLCACVCMDLCVLCEYNSLWRPEEGVRGPELELQTLLSHMTLVLVTELGSSSRPRVDL